jgi:cell wall-associated NlpC family hydrolase
VSVRPAWAAKWVGLEFESKGRGPERFDCWGLCRAAVIERFGVALPMYVEGYRDAEDAAEVARVVAAALPAWRAVGTEERREGDVVLLRTQSGHGAHVGLLVGDGFVLEMLPHVRSVCTRSGGPIFGPRILGAFRHPLLEDACPIC